MRSMGLSPRSAPSGPRLKQSPQFDPRPLPAHLSQHLRSPLAGVFPLHVSTLRRLPFSVRPSNRVHPLHLERTFTRQLSIRSHGLLLRVSA
ncbi:hypothetical protein SCLCIDRAFT_853680 [Scleroderma citrinum Foug A]|uniref:Uncharacterized protein n=1 Tax=Scleroderma citrinum Foug A TaxID=1036808 RepID=A0A0C3AAP3_9AGAM|nr:hypothetical protein SCLCIDRAFT_853680 [Scleroderma citrinum Foug A]